MNSKDWKAAKFELQHLNTRVAADRLHRICARRVFYAIPGPSACTTAAIIGLCIITLMAASENDEDLAAFHVSLSYLIVTSILIIHIMFNKPLT
jgi:hypothetical protein